MPVSTKKMPAARVKALLSAVVIMAAMVFALAVAGCAAQDEKAGPSTSEPSVSTVSQTPSESLTKDEWVSQTIGSMSLEQKIDQLFILRPEVLAGAEGTITAADDNLLRAIGSHHIGGLIFYQRNLTGEEQTKAMLGGIQRSAQEAADLPVLLCVDEEGGPITRIGDKPGYPFGNVGSLREIGASGDPQNARDAGKKIGRYLTQLGFNVDFAPVADIAYSSESFMYDRSFGADAELVSSMVAAEVEGFSGTGMLCALKHFPGLGDSRENTDYGISVTDRTLEDIEGTDFKPFEAGIEAGAPIVMVGHLLTPSITNSEMPASLSSVWMTDELRGKLGFEGIVITDALEVPAVEASVSNDQVGVAVIKAGGDMILSPFDYEAARDGLIAAVKSGELTEKRIDESLTRILSAKYGLL